MWSVLSDIMFVLVLLCVIAIPVLLITFVILWVTKRRKMWVGLSAWFCFLGIIIFALLGGLFNYVGMTPEERLAQEVATESISEVSDEADEEQKKQEQEDDIEKEEPIEDEIEDVPVECIHSYIDIESNINIGKKKITVKQACSLCGEEKTETRDMTDTEVENYLKENCNTFTYEEMARYPDEHKGELVVVTGNVIQVQELWGETILLVNVTEVGNEYYSYYKDTVYINYEFSDGLKVLEDDIITLYGELNGEETYTTVLGSANTIPRLEIYYAELGLGD